MPRCKFDRSTFGPPSSAPSGGNGCIFFFLLLLGGAGMASGTLALAASVVGPMLGSASLLCTPACPCIRGSSPPHSATHSDTPSMMAAALSAHAAMCFKRPPVHVAVAAGVVGAVVAGGAVVVVGAVAVGGAVVLGGWTSRELWLPQGPPAGSVRRLCAGGSGPATVWFSGTGLLGAGVDGDSTGGVSAAAGGPM